MPGWTACTGTVLSLPDWSSLCFSALCHVRHRLRCPVQSRRRQAHRRWAGTRGTPACPLSERTVEQTIDALVSSGMRDAGYRYVNLDAGWAAPTRDADGNLRADPDRFPGGIAAVARYAHDRGLLLGLYNSPFNEACGQDPRIGSAGHEAVRRAAVRRVGRGLPQIRLVPAGRRPRRAGQVLHRDAGCVARQRPSDSLQHQSEQFRCPGCGHPVRLVGDRRPESQLHRPGAVVGR